MVSFLRETSRGNISKVVDENLEPKVVYHGTNAEFTEFDLSEARQNADIPAFFFSNDLEDASGYGKAGSYFLSIKNPKIDKPLAKMEGFKVREELIEQGFDGIITYDEEYYVEYAAFNPNQIKSVDNVGTFSKKTNHILFQDEADYFTPSVETENNYKQQVKNALDNENIKINTIIDMGELPPIYSAVGILDKELKTSKRSLLKGLGLFGENIHNAPKGILENLISYIYNPAAIFKSLSTSKNPDGYIAVLDAEVEGKPIVAILSPSKNDDGYTFIPSVYERDNFKKFVENVSKENKILYVENKSSKLWGQQQLPPLHNQSSDYTILTKADFVNEKNNNCN